MTKRPKDNIMCYIESAAERHAETWMDSASQYIFDQAFDEFKSLYNREPDHWTNLGDSIKLEEIYCEIIFNYTDY